MILVTGATGTNGVALIEELAEISPERVRALARDPEKAAKTLRRLKADKTVMLVQAK